MATSQRKKVGVGWLKTSQDGQKQYISIVINGGLSPDINLVMFKNGFKEKENQPDFMIYLNAPKDAADAKTPQDHKVGAPADFPEASAGGEQYVPQGACGDEDVPF